LSETFGFESNQAIVHRNIGGREDVSALEIEMSRLSNKVEEDYSIYKIRVMDQWKNLYREVLVNVNN
jgi:hypothetical protein